MSNSKIKPKQIDLSNLSENLSDSRMLVIDSSGNLAYREFLNTLNSTLFVDPNGDDSGSAIVGSINQPWATVSQAIYDAENTYGLTSYTIHVFSGIYIEYQNAIVTGQCSIELEAGVILYLTNSGSPAPTWWLSVSGTGTDTSLNISGAGRKSSIILNSTNYSSMILLSGTVLNPVQGTFSNVGIQSINASAGSIINVKSSIANIDNCYIGYVDGSLGLFGTAGTSGTSIIPKLGFGSQVESWSPSSSIQYVINMTSGRLFIKGSTLEFNNQASTVGTSGSVPSRYSWIIYDNSSVNDVSRIRIHQSSLSSLATGANGSYTPNWGFIYTHPSSSNTSILLDGVYFHTALSNSAYPVNTLYNGNSRSYTDTCILTNNTITSGSFPTGDSGTSSWNIYPSGYTVQPLSKTARPY